MNPHPIFTALADEPGDRKTQWLRVQELASQWRETGQPHLKTEAADLLGKLMAADALIKIKTMRVDAKLPARLRRNYEEMASDVAASVLANPNTRATAILENHDPEQALMSTMVNFYLRNKIVDHLREQPVEGIFRTVARTAKAKAEDKAGGAAPQTITDTHVTGEKVEEDAKDDAKDDPAEQLPGTTLLTDDPQETPHAPRYQPSSMLADDAPGAAHLPQGDSAWDTEHELLHDLADLLSPQQQEIVDYVKAGYTSAEAATELGISVSTYKRRLADIKFKIEAYTSGN